MAVKKVGILYHPLIQAASSLAREVAGFLQSRRVDVWLCSAWEGERASSLLDGTELIITVGGDGTILRAAQVVAALRIPVTGINLGKLGFMTELSTSEAMDRLPALLDGKGWLDERAMLDVELMSVAKGAASQVFHALNDIVVARGSIARVIYIETVVDGEPLTTYKADGVILATATGSTAYSLASGGPILPPQSKEFLLMPILPHLGSSYRLALPATSVVELHVGTTHEAALCVDGHINIPLTDDSRLKVRHSPNTIRFLRIHPRSFYSTLEQRLKGKQ